MAPAVSGGRGIEPRLLATQALVFAAVAVAALWLGANLFDNLAARSIHTGFGFLWQRAGFGIGDHLIGFDSRDSYGRALLVGLVNTLAVAGAGILLSTLLGLVIGLARLSGNALAAPAAAGYVEAVRGVPLLLQLFVWYAVFTDLLPPAPSPLRLLPGVWLSKAGLNFPAPVFSGGVWFDIPARTRFGFSGGAALSPEFTALLLGLVCYNAAFIAEIVRSGIQSVGRGQRDAAKALGLRRGAVLRLVVLPQALRVALPPLGSQYVNLAKNSSLAVAIGYPDLMSVADTTLNQTGQAIEVIGLTMLAYLAISLAISAAVNWCNARVTRQGAA